MRWKQGENRRIHYPVMEQHGIKEIRIELELKGREQQAGLETNPPPKKKRCLSGYVPPVMNTEARLESIAQKLLTYRLIILHSL
jgi:hypothetical protein